jgi:hypothetical protein
METLAPLAVGGAGTMCEVFRDIDGLMAEIQQELLNLGKKTGTSFSTSLPSRVRTTSSPFSACRTKSSNFPSASAKETFNELLSCCESSV